MKAVLCREFTGLGAVSVENIAAPVCGPDDMRVRVEATSLNFADTLMTKNKYQFTPDLPFSPGGEISGTILEVGEHVTSHKPNERVMAYIGWGGAREQVLIRENQAVLLPDNVPFEAAAGLSVTYGTTLYALKNRANMQVGETLVVLGAAGGVGQAAIEIGKIMGARIIAVASSEEKLDFCKSLGADEVLLSDAGSLKQNIKDMTGGKGADVIYDSVGGDLSEQALRATGWEGRFLVIGFASGDIPKIPLNLTLVKGNQIMGVFWGEFVSRCPEMHRENMAQIIEWFSSGMLKPHIHQTYGLDDTKQALEDLLARKVMGKAIITPQI